MALSDKNTVYVVTGGNRGIGLGLVKALLARPFTTILASVRNDETAANLSSAAQSFTVGEGSDLRVVKLDFSESLAPNQIRDVFKIDRIDVLINNAGHSPSMTLSTETSAEHLRQAFEVNTIAPLMVFQGLWPILKKSATPKLIMMTSSVGCISHQEGPGGAYGPSKAALNWITRALHIENEAAGLVAVALHPGWVQTRMGEFCARQWGFSGAPPETVEGSAQGILEVIDGATRDTVSGKFVTYKGQILPW